eukprot:5567138-Amphidinium_carterae.1
METQTFGSFAFLLAYNYSYYNKKGSQRKAWQRHQRGWEYQPSDESTHKKRPGSSGYRETEVGLPTGRTPHPRAT